MPATNGILINHAALDQAADDLVTAVKSIQNRMDQLEHELSPLQSDWEGEAQQAYNQSKSRWDTAIDEMVQILGQTSQAVHAANDGFATADRHGANSLTIGG